MPCSPLSLAEWVKAYPPKRKKPVRSREVFQEAVKSLDRVDCMVVKAKLQIKIREQLYLDQYDQDRVLACARRVKVLETQIEYLDFVEKQNGSN